MKRNNLMIILLSIFLVSSSVLVIAQTSDSQNGYNLTIWDDTDSVVKRSEDIVTFYLNLTNSTDGTEINDSITSCNISFNYNSSWTTPVNMTFNNSLWEYNRSFNYKGEDHQFNISCNVSVNLSEVFEITNTKTSFTVLGTTTNGDEDTLLTYNFSQNVTDPDVNDNILFSIEEINSTNHSFSQVSEYYWININNSTGILTINATKDNETATRFDIAIYARDDAGAGESDVFFYVISPVNDAPYFTNATDFTVNEEEASMYNVSATDEESDVPYTFNVSFVNCTRPFKSPTYNTGSNCEFNTWNWTSGSTWMNLNFTTTGNETGTYFLNLSVTDNETSIEPYNASNWTIVELTVAEINDRPILTYVCDNEREATEDSLFTCYVNATDEDERYNLTFNSNYSWFLNSIVDTYNVTSDDFANATINFTPSDINVGNWSIEVSVTDTGNSSHEDVKSATETISFLVNNVNDSCYLDSISDQEAYTLGLFNITLHAEDNDLLIPDKSIFDEDLTFEYNTSPPGLSLDLTELEVVSGTNESNATLSFTPESGETGSYIIGITVTDLSGNTDYKQFNLTVSDNNPAQWNDSEIPSYFDLTEDIAANINLSEYAYDADSDDINFSYSLQDTFPNFDINEDTGMITFVPLDVDVGIHTVNMSVTDGKNSYDYHTFTFNVSYTNESPNLENISDQNATEDQLFTMYINATDGDLEIPDSVFNESLTFSHNSTLDFNISISSVTGNLTIGLINFTPDYLDVGVYTINVTVTDNTSNSSWKTFVLNISEVNDPPYFLQNISNQTATEGDLFTLDINASDEEQGNESSGNLTFTSNVTWINDSMNRTTGLINTTPDGSTPKGSYPVNVTVSDGFNSTSLVFNITVKSVSIAPTTTSESPSLTTSIAENDTETFYAKINDSNIGFPNYDLLNASWLLDEVLQYSEAELEDGWVSWNYTPGFDEETTGGDPKNLTLYVEDLDGNSTSYTWQVTVTHTNAPPVFSGSILNQSGNTGIEIDLDNYFTDEDHTDTRYNQSINFSIVQYEFVENWTSMSESNYTSSSSISTNLDEEYVLTFSSSSAESSLFKITAIDGNDSTMNVSSNIFKVEISPTESESQTPSTSGGGGGATKQEIVSINFVTPGPLKMYKNETIETTILLENNGITSLSGIDLSLNGSENLEYELNETYIASLGRDETKNLTLIVRSFKRTGDEEITITADVRSPSFTDTAKIHVTVLEREIEIVKEKITFTEQLIADNPACLELEETVDLAKAAYETGDYELAIQLADQAVNACRAEVSSTAIKDSREVPLLRPYLPAEFTYLLLGLIVALVVVYYIKRFSVKRKNEGKFKSKDDDEIKIEVE